jgi:hypothetical protein
MFSPNSARWMRLAALAALIALAVAIGQIDWTKPSGDAERGSIPADGARVSLSIDYGDGQTRSFKAIKWREGMTVLNMLESAAKQTPGVQYEIGGSGELTILNSIDGVENQGGGDGAKNWIFTVNGRLGDKSCAVARVEPSDAVLWKFDLYE